MSKTKKGTDEAARIAALKDAEKETVDWLAAIDARIEALKAQRQQNAQQRAQKRQDLQKLETEGVAASGALAILQSLREELAKQ